MNTAFVIRLPKERYESPSSERLEAMETEAREIERRPKCRWSASEHVRWMLAQVALRDLTAMSSEYRELS